jgi:hypothetical protein
MWWTLDSSEEAATPETPVASHWRSVKSVAYYIGCSFILKIGVKEPIVNAPLIE